MSDDHAPNALPFPATPVWIGADHGAGRNAFVLFRRELDWDGGERLDLCLFADTRYRLRINGHIITHGPARFARARPEYDTLRLDPLLRKGSNVVTVEVNAYGAPTFEAEPSDRGLFVAWGGGERCNLATPGEWLVRPLASRDSWAPPWSFAQAPVEILNPAEDRPEWHLPSGATAPGWKKPTSQIVTGWGLCRPRSIPSSGENLTRLSHPVGFTLANDHERLGFRVSEPGRRGRHAPYALTLWSPRDQDVVMRLFWGPHFLNGQPLPAIASHPGNREDHLARVRSGWNVLYGEPELLQDAWGVLIGLPRSAGLRPAGEESPPRWDLRHGPAFQRNQAPAALKAPESRADWTRLVHGWTRVDTARRPPLPAREMAWDEPHGPAQEPDGAARSGWTLEANDHARSLVFDAGSEFIARWQIDLDAPEGACVDIGVDERLAPSGLVTPYRDQFLNNTADRIIWPGGRHTVTGFRPRGGRFVQLTFRDAHGPLRLHSLSLRNALVPLDTVGAFACSDPVLTWAWRAGAETIRASYEDAFVDPWRERGVYIGDVMVEHLATAALSADQSMTIRCLRNWAEGPRIQGLLIDNGPSCHDKALADYSLLWILVLRNVWARSGDTALVAELWPTVWAILDSPAWRETRDGLWDADGLSLFIDWAVCETARADASGPLNMLRLMALEAATELALVIARADEAVALRHESGRVRRAVKSLWCPATRAFAASRKGDALRDAPCLHTTILGLATRVVPPEHDVPTLQWAVRRLRENHLMPARRVELFFLFHALGLLYSRGLAGEAEEVMAAHYGVMKRHGAWTLWERLSEGIRGHGSLCHGWSASPTHYLSERILGVQWARPGDPSVVTIAPESTSLDWAEGRVPHPLGVIEVKWRVERGVLHYEVHVPRGLRFHFEPRGRLARLPRRKAPAAATKTHPSALALPA